MKLFDWIFEGKEKNNIDRYEVDTWKSWVEYEKEYDAMIEVLNSQPIAINE